MGRAAGLSLVRWALVVAALILASGCSGTADPEVAPQRTPSALGGETATEAEPPADEMNLVEKTIAQDLSRRLRAQELSLDYLDCPRFHHSPRRAQVVCQGYLAGVVADVRVTLWGRRDNRRYDASLDDGVIATSNLVRRLAAEGYRKIDCGDLPAYRSSVGDQIICTVTKGERQKYVVATVTTSSGAVEISDY